MKEKYLPIGTVVTLKDATKRIMIIGYCPMAADNKVFDYSACTYPEGMVSTTKTLAFNHDQIVKVDFMGLEDAEQIKFNEDIKKMISGIETLKKVNLPSQTSGNSVASNNIPDVNASSTNINSISDIVEDK